MDASPNLGGSPSPVPATAGIEAFRWQPALDALRAIAVVHVAFHHVEVGRWIGFWGVDLFFVLSGFLITTVLTREWLRRGRLDFGRFYRRRVLRLYPALLAMVGLVGAVGWGLMVTTSYDVTLFWKSTLASLFYSMNFFLMGTEPSFPGWVHLWSLSIEEQYYLCWPLALWGLLRLGPRRMAQTCVAVLLVLFAWIVMLTHGLRADALRVYYGTDVRAFELMFGGACGLLPYWLAPMPMSWLRDRIDRIAVVVFCAMLVYAFLPTEQTRWGMIRHFLIMSFATGTIMLNIAYGKDRTLARYLAHPWLVYVGRLSYSIYLWNWPIAALLKGDMGLKPPLPPGAPTTVAMIVGTLAFAMGSYHLIEQPVARRWLQNAVVPPPGKDG